MTFASSALLCLGLWLGQRILAEEGTLPKPALWANPGPVVPQGAKVALYCSISERTKKVELWKEGRCTYSVKEPKVNTSFLITNMTRAKAGTYQCRYDPGDTFSEFSDPLELVTPDLLPGPSFSAWPGPEVVSGGNVILLCQTPFQGVELALYKEGEAAPVKTKAPTLGAAEFHITNVSIRHSGKYSCRYYLGPDNSVQTQSSNSLRLVVIGSEPRDSLTIIITLVCLVASVFLLILLVFCYRHTQRRAPPGRTAKRFPSLYLCPCCRTSSSSGESPEDIIYAVVDNQRHLATCALAPQDPENGNSVGMTYAQLNKEALSQEQKETYRKPWEPTLYAVMSVK